MIISIDLGTTHTKAGIFSRNGELIRFARKPTALHQKTHGPSYYDPEEMWAGVLAIIKDIIKPIDPREISAIGISSMAETGLLVGNLTGSPQSPMLPWHDRSSIPQFHKLEQDRDPIRQFTRSGIRPNFKCSLAKLLWISENHPGWLEGSTWLSTADYIAFRLTGKMATDYSLAGRTYAFRIDELSWDEEWLHKLGLPGSIFPRATPSGRPVAELSRTAAVQIGLPSGLPVCISGHDHVCAAYAAIGTISSQALDSMGTAEALIGNLARQALGTREYKSGLVFGRHVAGGGYYWMGGLSTSGGSLDWARKILAEPTLSYQQFEDFLASIPLGPSGIIYLPYLVGSGSPHTDIHARGALIGLDQSHDRQDLIKAILEGTSFEMEFIRQTAQDMIGKEVSSLVVSGGGTQIRQWMQIKSDVSGCLIEVPAFKEATLLGCALVAGIGSGLFRDEAEARSSLVNFPCETYHPNPFHHHKYQQLFQEGFLALQAPLREFSAKISSAAPASES